MEQRIWDYISVLFNGIPLYVYAILCIIAILGITVFLIFRRNDSWKYIARLLSIEYVALILSSTVVFRQESSERIVHFIPYWGNNSSGIYDEVFMNIFVFIPLGLFLGASFHKQTFIKTLMTGILVSVIVEALQFVFKRGVSETDDVIHNSLGCLIGYALCSMINKRNVTP